MEMNQLWTGKTGGPLLKLSPGADRDYPGWSGATKDMWRKLATLGRANLQRTIFHLLHVMHEQEREELIAASIDRRRASEEPLSLFELSSRVAMANGTADRKSIHPSL